MSKLIESSMPQAKARDDLSGIVSRAIYNNMATILIRRGKKVAVVIPYEEFRKNHPEMSDQSGS